MLRATLVQAELMLLRVLGFELRLSSPMVYLSRYLERAMEELKDAGEDYEAWGKEERAEYGAIEGGWMETGLGRRAREKTVNASDIAFQCLVGSDADQSLSQVQEVSARKLVPS